VLGDIVRVIVREGGPNAEAIAEILRLAGVATTRVRAVRVDMEATFAFLAEEARAARPSPTPDDQDTRGIPDTSESEVEW